MSRFRGVFTIPCTPFTEAGALDEASLRREVEFCLQCGAHGLVAPVNASEFTSLSDLERQRVVEIVAEVNAGRRPFVAGVSGVSSEVAVWHARHAREVGADALIAMPPYVRKASPPEIVAYYRALGEVGLPIFVQNWVLPIGTPMAPDFLARLAREIEAVEYLKEETQFAPQVMTAVRQLAGDHLRGVMGGQAGRYLFTEHARGACGTMPACDLTDLQVDLWEALDAGREAEARDRFRAMLPLLNFEQMYGVAAYKEILRRRGVIATAVCRGAPAALDRDDLRELDRLLADVEPYFRWQA